MRIGVLCAMCLQNFSCIESVINSCFESVGQVGQSAINSCFESVCRSLMAALNRSVGH